MITIRTCVKVVKTMAPNSKASTSVTRWMVKCHRALRIVSSTTEAKTIRTLVEVAKTHKIEVVAVWEATTISFR